MTHILHEKIKSAAFAMFRDWTKNAKLKHPDFDFTIIDETILVSDLTNSIKTAVNSLKKEEKIDKRSIPGYDTGYMLGFINSNLNGHWVHEYIRKRGDDYKVIMTLKAIQLYFEIREIALIEVDEIYKRLLKKDINFEGVFFTPDKKTFSDFGSNIEIDIENKRENNISIALDNLITEKVVKIISEKDQKFLPETEHYFSREDIAYFISEF